MMAEPIETYEHAVTEGLKQGAASLKRVSPGLWSLSLANGRLVPGTARIDDMGWFLLDVPLDEVVGRRRTGLACKRLYDLLKWNAGLPGAAKFVVEPRDRSVRLRVEIPLDQGGRPGLAGEITLACQGCKAALRKFCDNAKSPGSAPIGGLSRTQPGDSRCDLQRLCREAGWNFVERASGRLSVALAASNGSYRAILAQRENADVSVSVDVAVWTSLPKVSRRSLALLLLSTAAFVRMVRPTVVETDKSRARFEMVFDSPCTSPQLAHALAALSRACDLCARESKLLQDRETIAREYLSAMSV